MTSSFLSSLLRGSQTMAKSIGYKGLVLSFFVFFSACGSSFDWKNLDSAQGYVPEAYLPQDLGMVMSFSLLDEAQYEQMQALQSRMNQGENLEELLQENFDAETQEVIQALGEKYRLVFGAKALKEGQKSQFLVATLEDVDQMTQLLTRMQSEGLLSEYKVQGNLAYANKDKSAYFMLEEDLLLMASRPDDLVGMLKQSASLKDLESYQEAFEEHGSDAVFFVRVSPSQLQSSSSALTGISALVDKQYFSVHAEEDGLALRYTMNADEEKLKKVGLEALYGERKPAYLAQDLPAGSLLALYEAYDLAGSFETLEKMGQTSPLKSQEEFLKKFLAMNAEEAHRLLQKGFVLALHQNGESILPGLSLIVDVQGEEDLANTMMEKIQIQLQSVAQLLNVSFPGLVEVSLSEKEEEWHRILLNLKALPAEQAQVLGATLNQEQVELVFGVKDGRWMMSLAENMDDETVPKLGKDPLYEEMRQRLKNDEGLVYMNAEALVRYVSQVGLLRQALGLESTEVLEQAENVLGAFDAFIASGQSSATGSQMEGFLKLKTNE